MSFVPVASNVVKVDWSHVLDRRLSQATCLAKEKESSFSGRGEKSSRNAEEKKDVQRRNKVILPLFCRLAVEINAFAV